MNNAPKVRQSGYYLASAVLAVLGIVQIWSGVETAATVEDISGIITGLLTLLGGAAPAVAGAKVSQQRKEGLFEALDDTLGPLVRQVLK